MKAQMKEKGTSIVTSFSGHPTARQSAPGNFMVTRLKVRYTFRVLLVLHRQLSGVAEHKDILRHGGTTCFYAKTINRTAMDPSAFASSGGSSIALYLNYLPVR